MYFRQADYEAIIKTVNEKNPFLKENDLKLISLQPGEAVASMRADERVSNMYGMVHGGALFSLADMAAGVCALTSSKNVVTLNSSISFLQAARPGLLRAVARCLHAGRTTGVYSVEIFDDAEALVASAQFTMFFYQNLKPGLSHKEKNSQPADSEKN